MEIYEHQFSGIGSYLRVFASDWKILEQGQRKYIEGKALCGSSTSNNIVSHVSPVRLDTRGQIVITHVTGSIIGIMIVATLAGPSVIEPRRCPWLPNFQQPHNDIPLKHPCDFNCGCMHQTVRHTLESLIILHLVEVLPERLLLPSDSRARNKDINVKWR